MFCRHKYGTVKDGHQYCDKCGKAVSAPERICGHEWTKKESYKERMAPLLGGRLTGLINIMECNHCGKMKKEVIDL